VKVGIIDYQMGNLFSVQNACRTVGLEPVSSSDPALLREVDAAILPGVGAFGEAMANLGSLGLVPAIKEFIAAGKPLMGVCLGMQLLFDASEEFGTHEGLGLIRGRVARFPNRAPDGSLVRVPQIAWNMIRQAPGMGAQTWEGSPLRGLAQGAHMYFVHSFYALPENRLDILTVTEYAGMEYCSGIRRGNVFATQFHPEKSAEEGLGIYRNWAEDIQTRRNRLP
jgi:imidazole glycerol-phosphate synthase subunit HisH